jgi:hypothetical protein
MFETGSLEHEQTKCVMMHREKKMTGKLCKSKRRKTRKTLTRFAVCGGQISSSVFWLSRHSRRLRRRFLHRRLLCRRHRTRLLLCRRLRRLEAVCRFAWSI